MLAPGSTSLARERTFESQTFSGLSTSKNITYKGPLPTKLSQRKLFFFSQTPNRWFGGFEKTGNAERSRRHLHDWSKHWRRQAPKSNHPCRARSGHQKSLFDPTEGTSFQPFQGKNFVNVALSQNTQNPASRKWRYPVSGVGTVLKRRQNATLSAFSELSLLSRSTTNGVKHACEWIALIMPSVTRKGAELVPNTVRTTSLVFDGGLLCTLPTLLVQASFQTARRARGATLVHARLS